MKTTLLVFFAFYLLAPVECFYCSQCTIKFNTTRMRVTAASSSAEVKKCQNTISGTSGHQGSMPTVPPIVLYTTRKA